MNHTRTLLASLLLTTGTALADEITAAQPIGLLDKNWAKNTDQSDFFLTRGPASKTQLRKVVFTAKIKDLPRTNQEQRAIFAQVIEGRDFTSTRFQINRETPLVKLATYTVAKDTKFGPFIPTTDDLGTSKKLRFEQMFFRVPGRGIFVTEGGGKPKTVRTEKATDPSTITIPGAVRLSDFINNNSDDPEKQSRFFFAAKDAKKGREPFIYGGTSKLLLDINTTAKMGSDPEQFVALGGQNESQQLFFVAKSPDDGDTYQLWRATLTLDSKNRPIYSAQIFTSGANKLVGKPEDMIANDSDLFFRAPVTAGGTPQLWHMRATGNNVVTDLEVLNAGGGNPDDFTFVTHVPISSSITALAFSVSDVTVPTVRRFARYRYTTNDVVVAGVAQGLFDPFNITDAGQEFYFGTKYFDGGSVSPFTFLQKYNLSDNTLEDVICSTPIPGGTINYIYDVGEICTVSARGDAGFVYFVASAYVDNAYTADVLFKLPCNQGPAFATPVRTPAGALVRGAKNLRAVVSDTTPAWYRLYFSAPVSRAATPEFVAQDNPIQDFGTKPWVTVDE